MAKRTKRGHGKPDPFQFLEVEATPATEDEARDALEAFIDSFVVSAKRERAKLLLLNPDRRARGLHEVSGWLDRRKTTELDGATGFPQNIARAVGNVRGIFLDGGGRLLRLTAPEGAVLGHDDALFIADDHSSAVLFFEIGSPTVCRARDFPAKQS